MQKAQPKRTAFPADNSPLPKLDFENHGNYSASIWPLVGGSLSAKGKLWDKTTNGKVRPYLFEGGWDPDRGPRSKVTPGNPENTNSFDHRDDGPKWRAISGFGRQRLPLQEKANLLINYMAKRFLRDIAFLEETFKASADTVDIQKYLHPMSRYRLDYGDDPDPIGPPCLHSTSETRRVGSWLVTRTTYRFGHVVYEGRHEDAAT